MSKLVLIGAGSIVFTKGLLADMLRPGAPQTIHKLALVDTDAETLDAVTRLAQRMAALAERDLKIEAATDRRAVLPGADYVVTTFAVGGRTGRLADVQIPHSFGIYLAIGDTVGPSGLSRALRHVPVMQDIARDVETLCPRAWLFNYANPMSCLVRAATRVRPHKTIGLCHGLPAWVGILLDTTGTPALDVSFDASGLNHQTYITRLCAAGVNVLARAHERSADPSWLPDNPFARELFGLYGAFPVPGDLHLTEFYPQFFRKGYYDRGRLGIDIRNLETVLAGHDAQFAAMKEEASGVRSLDKSVFEQPSGEHEKLLEIIRAIETNSGELFTANIPNGDLVLELPRMAVVEVPIRFTRDSVQAAKPMPLPSGVVPNLAARALQQEMTVDAAIAGDRRLALHALLADGWIDSVPGAERLLDLLLKAHKQNLPQFA